MRRVKCDACEKLATLYTVVGSTVKHACNQHGGMMWFAVTAHRYAADVALAGRRVAAEGAIATGGSPPETPVAETAPAAPKHV